MLAEIKKGPVIGIVYARMALGSQNSELVITINEVGVKCHSVFAQLPCTPMAPQWNFLEKWSQLFKVSNFFLDNHV